MQSYCNLLSCVITLCILRHSAQNAYAKNCTAIITAIIEGMWHYLQAAANIWATMYYFTGKNLSPGLCLGKRLTIPWPAFLWPIKHFVAI